MDGAPSSPATVAVIGAGAAGLAAAWLLSRGNYRVHLFEADAHAGGHANTIDLPIPGNSTGATIPVDAGFIVYNTQTYPDLVSLFEMLGVEEENSTMSFSASVPLSRSDSFFEWGSDSLATLFADRANLYRPAMYTMLFDMRRFNNAVYDFVNRLNDDPSFPDADITLGEFLENGCYSSVFIRAYLIPMVSSVWSASFSLSLSFPARTLFRFFVNHGLAQVLARPQWRTLAKRSRDYVNVIISQICENDGLVFLKTPVNKVERSEDYVIVHAEGRNPTRYDHVIFSTHPPTTLQLIGDGATEDERDILGAFTYSKNSAYIHNDPRLMPTNRAAWSAWNFICRHPSGSEGESSSAQLNDEAPVCVSYWLNKLQNFHKHPHPVPDLFLTLNPVVPIDPDKKLAELSYEHPQFTEDAIRAQPLVQTELQGKNRSWFCGSFARYGFHEDAMMMGFDVAERLSNYTNIRPWRSRNMLAINDNARLYQLPCSPLRNPLIFFLGALFVINAVMARLQQGLGKLAARMAEDDPVVVIASGDGRLYKLRPPRVRRMSKSLSTIIRRDSLATEEKLEPSPRSRVTVKSPSILVRIAEALRQGHELAPTAAAAFAASELDCPSPADLSSALEALFIADGLDLDPSRARKGRAKFAESLLYVIVGGIKKVDTLPTHTRVPELTTCISNVVYPSWWLEFDEEVEIDGKFETMKTASNFYGDESRRPETTLEFLGDLSETTVAILQRHKSFRATVVVRSVERIAFVSRKAELLLVRDQITIFLLEDFIEQRKSAFRSPNRDDPNENVYDIILSPSLLNVYGGSGFSSIAEALCFLRNLATPETIFELGATVYGARGVSTSAKKVRSTDCQFSGDDQYVILDTRDVIDEAEVNGFELQRILFMNSKEASMDVSEVIQRVFTSLAPEKLEPSETRVVLSQMCLWEAALKVKYFRRVALYFKLS